MQKEPMETLQHALDRLAERGYRHTFRATPEGFFRLPGGGSDGEARPHAPEELVVDEMVRFEGESDPQEEAVLLALRSKRGGARGTFVTNFGPGADPVAGELMRRLDRDRGGKA